MSLSTAIRTSDEATLDAAEVEHIVSAAVKRLARMGAEFYSPRLLGPDEPLTLLHRPTGREFSIEIRAFEVTGHDG